MMWPVRRLSLNDMDRAAFILRAALDDRLPWLAGLHTPQEDREFLRGHVFPACEMWGGGGAEITGFIAFREGWIDHLHVLPAAQGRGVGGALLNLAQSMWPSLSLWTFQRNWGARAFYERRGFALIRTTDGHANEEKEPDALYRWPAGARGLP